MRYAGIITNDCAATPGVSVSFFAQGCPNRCPGCHNPETWDFQGGLPFTEETMQEILKALTANGIQRNFSIMGGEPLCEENLELTYSVVQKVRETFPSILIYIWSGYYLTDLKNRENPLVRKTLEKCDVLIDGPFILEQKDLTLPLRGSANQGIHNLKEEL